MFGESEIAPTTLQSHTIVTTPIPREDPNENAFWKSVVKTKEAHKLEKLDPFDNYLCVT